MRSRIAERIEEHFFGDMETHKGNLDATQFTKRLEMMLVLTHQGPRIWKGSTISEKRELLNFLFANLSLKGATLCYSIRKPFDELLLEPDRPEWRGVMDGLRTNPEMRMLILQLPVRFMADLARV